MRARSFLRRGAKSVPEMRMALEADILCVNVESAAELERLNEVAEA